MKTILLILSSLALSLNIYPQRALSDKEWIEDLDFMISRLDSIHPDLYANIYKEQMQERAKELREKVPMLSDNEIIAELLKVVTAIHDGHTRLHGRNLTKKWYPLRIEKFSDGYYITAISSEHSKFIEAKILAFNSKPIGIVFDKLKEITPHDNSYGQDYFAPMYLTMSSILSDFI
jgi:hypothetical protein